MLEHSGLSIHYRKGLDFSLDIGHREGGLSLHMGILK